MAGVPAGPEAPRPVTYEQAFDILPFGNQIVVKTMTGDAVVRLLEQQFENRTSECGRLLQVAGIEYAYDADGAAGRRIDRASIRIGGRPLVETDRYRIASNDFLWGGGDNFLVAREGFDAAAAGLDIDLFVEHLARRSPLPVPVPGRIRRLP
jgi:5'-nucleotidase